MKKFHCLEIVFNTTFSDKKQYHSHLYLDDNIIEIRIYLAKSSFVNQFMNWYGQNQESDRITDYLEVSVSSEEEELKNISISYSKITRIVSEQIDEDGKSFFSIFLDQIVLYKPPVKDERLTARIYLNDDGFDLVKDYYSLFTGFKGDGTFDIKRMRGMDEYYTLGNSIFRPEFEFAVSDKKISRRPEIEKIPILKFTISTQDEDEIINYLNVACKICSFYLGNNIEYFKSIISLKEHRIIIRKTLETKFTLKISSINWLMSIRGIHEFLKKDWQTGYLQNQNKLDKAITNYTHSRLLDPTSKFILLYNIIDICMGGYKPEADKFKLIGTQNKRTKNYKAALESLKQNISPEDFEDFEIKWESAVKQLVYKPMKSTLTEFLSVNKIQLEKLEVSIAEMKKIRDQIFHGRVNFEMQELIHKSNIQLFRITPILILNLLGISDWEQKS